MRFGRILLASLTALAAYSYAQQAPAAHYESLPRLLNAVVPIFAAAVDSQTAAPMAKSPAHAILALDVLNTTPRAGSLILLSSSSAVDLLTRRHQRQSLRC